MTNKQPELNKEKDRLTCPLCGKIIEKDNLKQLYSEAFENHLEYDHEEFELIKFAYDESLIEMDDIRKAIMEDNYGEDYDDQ